MGDFLTPAMAPTRPFPWLLATCALAILLPGFAGAQPSSPPQVPVAQVDALTLAQAGERLMTDGPAVRAARRAAETAASEVRRVDVSPNPSVSVQVSNTVARQYRYPDSDRLLRVEQLLERGGKRQLRVELARHAERAARLDLADVLRQQRAALAGTYYDLAAAQALLAIAEDTLADQARLEAAAERRLQAGDVSPLEVSRLRVESSRLANEARAARAAVAEARIRLAVQIGAPARASGLQAIDPLPPAPADDASVQPALPVPEDRIEAAQLRRADAAAAAARLEALQSAVRLAESLRTRDVTVGAQAERAPGFGGSVFGLSLSLPLLVNNDYSGEILRARAELAQAQEELDRIRAGVRADVERALAQLAAARDRARRLDAIAVPEARRAAEGVAFAYARGAIGLIDLLDARRQQAAVRADDVLARAEYAKALADARASLATEDTP